MFLFFKWQPVFNFKSLQLVDTNENFVEFDTEIRIDNRGRIYRDTLIPN